MKRSESLHLRLELLRMRGQIERAEMAAAVVELRLGARRFGAIAAAVSSVGGALSGTGGAGSWAGVLVDTLGAAGMRSLWARLGLVAVRAIRRQPAVAIALTVGVTAILGWWLARKPRPAAPDRS
jgi:hypothetical protein